MYSGVISLGFGWVLVGLCGGRGCCIVVGVWVERYVRCLLNVVWVGVELLVVKIFICVYMLLCFMKRVCDFASRNGVDEYVCVSGFICVGGV